MDGRRLPRGRYRTRRTGRLVRHVLVLTWLRRGPAQSGADRPSPVRSGPVRGSWTQLPPARGTHVQDLATDAPSALPEPQEPREIVRLVLGLALLVRAERTDPARDRSIAEAPGRSSRVGPE